MLILIE